MLYLAPLVAPRRVLDIGTGEKPLQFTYDEMNPPSAVHDDMEHLPIRTSSLASLRDLGRSCYSGAHKALVYMTC